MRRADRLFQIIQYLRGRRLTTARQLAEWLEVSPRTIYRDVNDLILSGVPIRGEAGVGYVLQRGCDIPPLMFSAEEVEALVLGARMVRAWGGAALAHAASQALVKIEAVLPERLQRESSRSRLFAPDFHLSPQRTLTLDQLRMAMHEVRVLQFDYTREDGTRSARSVHPLGLFYWGSVWTLAAWCELRQDFRSFRIDRMAGIRLLERRFTETPGHTLADFLRAVRARTV